MGASTDELKIPNLGDSSTSLFSAEQEYQLGRAWLSIYRNQAPISDDPLLSDYLEQLVYHLATYSQLEDRRLETVIASNPTLNAFAVPGGVIGVHEGLFTYAQSEAEFATVIAHELAHLSQRHFSRSVEAQKRQAPLNLAGLLAGLVLIATTGSDAGLAALTASQAAALEAQLRFSRNNEREADQIGIQTLAKSGMDPYAAPAMFERMLRARRYNSRNIPEFLLTHPVTESRISDARNRARHYPKTDSEEGLYYHLMRARVQLAQAKNPQLAIQQFRTALEGQTTLPEAQRYGLVLALTASGQLEEARSELQPLLQSNPEEITYVIADAEIDIAQNQPKIAADKLATKLRLSPGNYPLTMFYAQALLRSQQAHIAEEVLLAISEKKPREPAIWYLLAETQGLSGNILGLHQARAEYFILTGNLDRATRQLEYAFKLARSNHAEAVKIQQRAKDIAELKEIIENL